MHPISSFRHVVIFSSSLRVAKDETNHAVKSESCQTHRRATTMTCSRYLTCYPLIVLSLRQNESNNDESPCHQQSIHMYVRMAVKTSFSKAIIACQTHLDQTVIAPFSILDPILLPTPCHPPWHTRWSNAAHVKSNQLMLLRLCNICTGKVEKCLMQVVISQSDKLIPGLAKGILPTPKLQHPSTASIRPWYRDIVLKRECRNCSVKRETWPKTSHRTSSKSVATSNFTLELLQWIKWYPALQ